MPTNLETALDFLHSQHPGDEYTATIVKVLTVLAERVKALDIPTTASEPPNFDPVTIERTPLAQEQFVSVRASREESLPLRAVNAETVEWAKRLLEAIPADSFISQADFQAWVDSRDQWLAKVQR